jgi:hypothetical protein
MGINYNEYTKLPNGGMDEDNLANFMALRFGQSMSQQMKEKARDVLQNEEVVGDAAEFKSKMFEQLSPLFEKNGKLGAQDSERLTKAIGDYYQLSVENVDVEGLLRAIFPSPRALGQLNALMTEKHGGKFGQLGKHFETIKEDEEALKNTPPDFGKKISEEIMAGMGGEFERLKGSIENFLLFIGQANEVWITPAMKGIGAALDAVSNSGAAAGLALTGVAAALAVFAGSKGIEALKELLRPGIHPPTPPTPPSNWISTAATAGGASAGGAALGGAGAAAAASAARKRWNVRNAQGRFARIENAVVPKGPPLGFRAFLGRAGAFGTAAEIGLRAGEAIHDWGKASGMNLPDVEVKPIAEGRKPIVKLPRMAPAEPVASPQSSLEIAPPLIKPDDAAAYAAGRQFGAAFAAGLAAEYGIAEQITREVVSKLVGALTFTANPALGPLAPAVAPIAPQRMGALDADALHTAYADTGFGVA